MGWYASLGRRLLYCKTLCLQWQKNLTSIMLSKYHYIVTIISLLIISLLIYLVWQSDKNYEYSNLGMSIHIIIAFLIAIIAGIIVLVKLPFRNRTNPSIYFYNFIGTFNICIGLAGGMFIYSDSGNQVTMQLLIFLFPFLIGISILKNIYFRNQKKNKID